MSPKDLKPGEALILPDGRRLLCDTDGSFLLDGDDEDGASS